MPNPSWRTRTCHPLNSLFYFLLFPTILPSTAWCFHDVHLNYMVIGRAFWWNNRVWSRYKCIRQALRSQNVINSSSIFTCSLHICAKMTRTWLRKNLYIGSNEYREIFHRKFWDKIFILWPLAMITTDSHSPANSFASLYSFPFKKFMTSTLGVGLPISS